MVNAKRLEKRKKFTKEYKIREIQKNLHKRSNQKRKYLKALKDEGYSVPEKEDRPTHSSRPKQQELRSRKKDKNAEKIAQRKEYRRKELEKISTIKSNESKRETRRERLSQKTRTGQPKMGPKIEDLLDKIKNDDIYTR